jgi:hypothetical protein
MSLSDSKKIMIKIIEENAFIVLKLSSLIYLFFFFCILCFANNIIFERERSITMKCCSDFIVYVNIYILFIKF